MAFLEICPAEIVHKVILLTAGLCGLGVALDTSANVLQGSVRVQNAIENEGCVAGIASKSILLLQDGRTNLNLEGKLGILVARKIKDNVFDSIQEAV